jgi:hypothetical protein
MVFFYQTTLAWRVLSQNHRSEVIRNLSICVSLLPPPPVSHGESGGSSFDTFSSTQGNLPALRAAAAAVLATADWLTPQVNPDSFTKPQKRKEEGKESHRYRCYCCCKDECSADKTCLLFGGISSGKLIGVQSGKKSNKILLTQFPP